MPSFYSFTSKFYLVVICAGLFLDVLYAFAANVKYRYSRSPRWETVSGWILLLVISLMVHLAVLYVADGFESTFGAKDSLFEAKLRARTAAKIALGGIAMRIVMSALLFLLRWPAIEQTSEPPEASDARTLLDADAAPDVAPV